ncbi:MAG TPA: LptA/OstA family protein [Opitutaceae bacterium]|jgi:lipopolysaccharide export system protein LptA|nr:LptA/OstA family protein [Opitutaceae bacterium]
MKSPHLGATLVFLASLAGPAVIRSAEPSPSPTIIVSQALDMHSTDTDTFSVFTGNVVVTGTDLRITCDRLDVDSIRSGEKTDTIGKQDNFKSLVATGHVHMVQLDREASCGRAEVLPREDKVILTENPVVIDHGNNTVATGEPLVLLHGERRVMGTNVHITLPPIKDLGFDKNAPPPAPDAAVTVPQK